MSSQTQIRELETETAGGSPRDPVEFLDDLSELLPHLDDYYKRSWQSPRLPSLPVAMVSFQDKKGQPLLAVACESGFLWVTSTENQEIASSVQIPGLGPGRGQIQALWASNALRSFGAWTELVLVTTRDPAVGEATERVVYRALARQVEDRIELRGVTDDADETAQPVAGQWVCFDLPKDLAALDLPRVRFATGIDPFAPVAGLTPLRRLRKTSAGTLVASAGKTHVLVEGGCRLRGPFPSRGKVPASNLDRWVRSMIVVPTTAGRRRRCDRVIVLHDGRSLEGLELHGDRWERVWEQSLSHLPLVIDVDPEAAGNEWPDIFAGLDDRRVVRFERLPPGKPRRDWQKCVEKLAAAAGLERLADWIDWCRQQFDIHRKVNGQESRDRQRTLHYLAVERALAADAEDGGRKLYDEIGEMMATERETRLLHSAMGLLERELQSWEGKPMPLGRVPDLVWACYEKAPFPIQELFDSHLRGVSQEQWRQLATRSESYGELAKNQKNMLISFHPEERIRAAGINLIRYMGRFATASFTPMIRDFGLRYLRQLSYRGDTYVAAVGLRKVRLYRLDSVELQEIKAARTDLGQLFSVQFARVFSLTGGRPVLLMGTRQGDLAVWDPFRETAPGAHLRGRKLGGILIDAAVVPASGTAASSRVLVARMADGKATLVRLHLRADGGLRQEASFDLDLRWIETMACFTWKGEHRALVGKGNDLVLLSGDLGEKGGGALSIEGQRYLSSPVKALVVLEAPRRPPRIFAGTRDGEVLCLKLDPLARAWSRAQWVYQVRRGVASLSLNLGDEERVSVLSTAGEVVLLSPEGLRVHRYQPPDAIMAAVLLSYPAAKMPDCLVVGVESGRMILLQETPEPAKSLEEAAASLEALSQDPQSEDARHPLEETPPNNEAGELGWLVARFRQKRDPVELYRAVQFRVSRHAIACLWGRHPELLKEVDAEELITTLTLRDLSRLLRDLPRDKAGWLRQALPRLNRFASHGAHGDQGIGAAGAVLYELLRIDREEEGFITIAQLRSMAGELMNSDWIAHLVAHHVVTYSGHKVDHELEFLDSLLLHLSGFPPRIARFAAVFAGGGRGSKALVPALLALGRFGEVIERQERGEQVAEVDVALAEVAAALRPWQRHEGLAGFLARFMRMILEGKKGQKGRRLWPEMVELVEEARAVEGESDLRGHLCRHVTQWIPAGQIDAQANLAEREEVLRDIRERVVMLDARAQDEKIEIELGRQVNSPWEPLCDELGRRGRHLLRDLSRLEEKHLRSRVWIRIEPRLRRLGADRVALDVVVRPETLKIFKDIEYTLDVSREEGLGSIGKPLKAKEEWIEVEPPKVALARRVSFRGTLATDQSSLVLRSTLRWKDEERASEFTMRWTLPERRSRAGLKDKLYSEAFAIQASSLVRELKGLTSGCLVVLLDEDLGRAGIVHELEEAGSRIVDLDSKLARYGPGRSYPKLLTLAKIGEALRGGDLGAAVPASVLGTKKIVMSRCDDLWRRLLNNPDLRPVFEETMAFLAARRNQKPALILLVDSKLGRRLLQQMNRSVPSRPAYRIPGTPESSDTISMWNDAAKWLSDGIQAGASHGVHAGVTHEVARRALEILGGDLRLALLLRQTAAIDPKAGTRLAKYAAALLERTEAREILQSELFGVPPRAIQLLIVAACSIVNLRFTQVVPGLVSADNVYSTRPGGGRGKLLLSDGEKIEKDHLRQLKSDRASQERNLVVDGYSRRGGSRMPPGIEHLAKFLGTENQVREMAQRLAERGAGSYTGGVVRALPPFRALIRAAIQGGAQVTEVYRHLTGAASPLGSLPLGGFSRLSTDLLREVDPALRPEQALMLIRLGKVWDALEESMTFDGQDLLLALETLTGMRAEFLVCAEGTESAGEWARLLPGERHYLMRLSPEKSRKGRKYLLAVYPPPEAGDAPATPSPEFLRAAAAEVGVSRIQLLIIRAGTAVAPTKDERWIEISENEVRDVGIARNWQNVFWAMIRTHAGGLHTLVPFQVGGALPPGSPIFFGREKEQEYILQNIRQQSFLIVGSRQVGKTSLKNQLLFRLRGLKDLDLYEIDLQGLSTRAELLQPLRRHLGRGGTQEMNAGDLFGYLAETAGKDGKLAVFLLNEIDLLIQNDPEFLWRLRGLHEENRARFIMIGYTRYAASACNDADSALYSWTTAPGDQKYMTLAELSYDAARQIVDLLEQPPLFLTWEPEHRERAIDMILDRTFRIPLLVQRFCKGLVERLEHYERYRLRLDDVEALARSNLLSELALHERLEAETLVPKLPGGVAREFVRLVLATTVKFLYFQGEDPAISDPELPHRDPRQGLSFDSQELGDWLREVFEEYLLPEELAAAKETLGRIDLDKILFGLTLTLILSIEPGTSCYYFQIHLYPRELQRTMGRGESIDDQILKFLVPFARYISREAISTDYPLRSNE